MKTKSWMLLPLAGALLAYGCTGTRDVQAEQAAQPVTSHDDDDDDDEEEYEVDIALSEVPESVKKAALEAVPGLVLSGAEKEKEHGQLVYSLEGTAAGEAYEVEVSAGGKVLEIERGEDEEDD